MSITFTERIKNILRAGEVLPPPSVGVHHFLRSDDHSKTRLHLRVEADGKGLLLINAARALHLNSTATQMAFWSLSNFPTAQIIRSISSLYQVPGNQAKTDYAQFSASLEELILPDGGCPICDLELDSIAPFSAMPSAPYRMDLALTYRCNNNCSHCYNARSRQYPELSTAEWKRVIDLLWQLGIPHIVFTGGEPTLRDDLPELIAHAEGLGQITGINTNGRRLKDPAFLQSLVQAGLDHIQITLESNRPDIHDQMVLGKGAWQETVAGIKNAVASKLYLMTNTTLLEANAPYLEETLHFLGELGVPTVGLNALIYAGKGAGVNTGLPEEALHPLLNLAHKITGQYGQKLIWYTPTQYCHFDPVETGFGVKGCTAAYYNMCVEPDGQVIPCQSYYQPIGHMLKDPWERIWNAPLALSIRNRAYVSEECSRCAILDVCGGGCPLAKEEFTPKAVMEKSWC